MKVYAYGRAWHCGRCASNITRQLLGSGLTKKHDRDIFPRGPFPDGGGKADTPQHCDTCHVFLQNPLTADGNNYVLDRAAFGMIPVEWRTFYADLFVASLALP